jgi:UDP-glucose 4-epimerase
VEASVLDLVRINSGVAGRSLQPQFGSARPGELERSVLAVDRAVRDLGWSPSTSLVDGIGKVYCWIEAGASERAPR